MYFLLVFIAMIIVGVFIVRQSEEQQYSQAITAMEQHVEELMEYSSTLHNDDWNAVKADIQELISKWPTSINDKIYVINSGDYPTLIASTSENLTTENMYFYVNSKILINSMSSKSKIIETVLKSGDEKYAHLSYPIFKEDGSLKGVIYVTSDLKYIYTSLNESKMMIIKATVLAIFISIFFGFFMASSITEPIRDVTAKAKKMAEGDFAQHVEIRSDDEIGQLAGMFNILTDELQRNISQIFKEKNKMETIFNYMADGLLVIDMKGNIMHVNQVAQRMLKLPYNSIAELRYEDINEEIRKSIELKYIEDKENWIGNELCDIGDSTYKVQHAPFRDENKVIGGLIIVFQDVTEQQKLDNMRKDFVANVSHELKTPITTIKTYTETIIDGVIDDKEMAVRFLQVIEGECDRMSRIVSDLLQLSRIDYNQQNWRFEPIELSLFLENICSKMEISAKERGQLLTCDVFPGTPAIFGDPDALEQVILNLLSNAIKYTPESGDIIVRAYADNREATIEIQDNGIGVPDEDLPRIFERFYRVDKARSREMGGTGLGLSIARQIVEGHKGKIWMESEYGLGTKVCMQLPLFEKQI